MRSVCQRVIQALASFIAALALACFLIVGWSNSLERQPTSWYEITDGIPGQAGGNAGQLALRREDQCSLRVAVCVFGVLGRGLSVTWPMNHARIVNVLRKRGCIVEVALFDMDVGNHTVDGNVVLRDAESVVGRTESAFHYKLLVQEKIDQQLLHWCGPQRHCNALSDFHRAQYKNAMRQLYAEASIGDFLAARNGSGTQFDVAIVTCGDYYPAFDIRLADIATASRTGDAIFVPTFRDEGGYTDGYYVGRADVLSVVLRRLHDLSLPAASPGSLSGLPAGGGGAASYEIMLKRTFEIRRIRRVPTAQQFFKVRANRLVGWGGNHAINWQGTDRESAEKTWFRTMIGNRVDGMRVGIDYLQLIWSLRHEFPLSDYVANGHVQRTMQGLLPAWHAMTSTMRQPDALRSASLLSMLQPHDLCAPPAGLCGLFGRVTREGLVVTAVGPTLLLAALRMGLLSATASSAVAVSVIVAWQLAFEWVPSGPGGPPPVLSAHEPIDCSALVNPIDPSPVRSPQQVHSMLAAQFAGKSIVEIGTRNGDGMMCFSRLARSATAIEYDPAYCKKLRERQQQNGGGGPHTKQARFHVSCGDYRKQHVPNADIFTWWQQQPHLSNEAVLNNLRKLQLQGKVSKHAIGIMMFDHKWTTDVIDWRRLHHMANWSTRIAFDERALGQPCPAQMAAGDGNRRFCYRASGAFTVAAIPIAKVPVVDEHGSIVQL